MGNAVANKYRSYGTGNLKFDNYSQKNKALNALYAEQDNLQAQIDKYTSYVEVYKNTTIPKLTAALSSDFEGFVINKVKNAKKYLNSGYNGDKSQNLNNRLDPNIESLNYCEAHMKELKADVSLRVRELQDKIRQLGIELNDVRSVTSRVRNTGVYQEPGNPSSFTY